MAPQASGREDLFPISVLNTHDSCPTRLVKSRPATSWGTLGNVALTRADYRVTHRHDSQLRA